MIKTVIFDLDDTLYSEIDYCRSGFHAVARHLAKNAGFPTENAIFDTIWQQFHAGNHRHTFDAALEQLSLPCSPEIIDDLITLYRNHLPKLDLPPASKTVLDNLAQTYTLALLTDGFLPGQQLKVKALGIENYFKCIVYTESLGRQYWKPSPAGFEKVLAECGVEAAVCVYVADNPVKDFIAPNRLGMKTIQLRAADALHNHEAPDRAALPYYVIGSISELPGILTTL